MPQDLNTGDDSVVPASEEHVSEVVTDNEDADSSLTIDNADTEREKFLNEHTDDGTTPVDDDASETETAVDVDDLDVKDDEPAETDDPPDDDSDETDDLDDADVDISDLDVTEEGAPALSDFDASKGSLSKTLWKSIPKEAQAYIQLARQQVGAQAAEVKKLEPLAEYASSILTQGKKAGFENDQVSGWLNTLFKANTGDMDAINEIGQVAIKSGYVPPAQELDLTEVDKLTTQWERDGDLDDEQIGALKAAIKLKDAPAPAKEDAPPQIDAATRQFQAARDQSSSTLTELAARFEKAYPKDWSKIEAKANTATLADNTREPLANPAEWPNRYYKNLKKAAKDVAAARTRKRAPAKNTVARTNSSRKGEKLSAREQYLRDNTY